jgi:hypothetical protein
MDRTLTAAIITDMIGDAQCPGFRDRCSASEKARFFYRYRARDGVLREIKLGDIRHQETQLHKQCARFVNFRYYWPGTKLRMS